MERVWYNHLESKWLAGLLVEWYQIKCLALVSTSERPGIHQYKWLYEWDLRLLQPYIVHIPATMLTPL